MRSIIGILYISFIYFAKLTKHILKIFERGIIIMNDNTFKSIIKEQLKRCTDILTHKTMEYATNDRLHNFKVAAALQLTTPKNALAGMLAKHTVSIYDMCRSNNTYSIEKWEEKITDHMNYLILLLAIIKEAKINDESAINNGDW